LQHSVGKKYGAASAGEKSDAASCPETVEITDHPANGLNLFRRQRPSNAQRRAESVTALEPMV
jgi:hypothetical protein